MKTYTEQELKDIIRKHGEWMLNRCVDERANLSGANLSEAHLSRADLSGANLVEANLSRADLSGADLSGANLFEAYLFEANLSGADLSRANLSEVDLSGADLSGANLSGANLSEADLSRANLLGVVGADIITYSRGHHQAIFVNGELRIGCQVYSLDYWLKHGEGIGRAADYSDESIKHYMKFIRSLADE